MDARREEMTATPASARGEITLGPWIPASAGMTTYLPMSVDSPREEMTVTPANAGVQGPEAIY
jgi:hypothetical protein